MLAPEKGTPYDGTRGRTDVLVVGAGMAGLTAARALAAHGLRVHVIDKGRSVGGRMATRRVGDGLADHGAQFFTVRWPEFRRLVDRWLNRHLAYEWSRGWADGSLGASRRSGHPRYAVHGGMNQLPKHLAADLAVDVRVSATGVQRRMVGWDVHLSVGAALTARAVLLTPPVPQSLALLDAGDVSLDPADRRALERLTYGPCLSGLFVLDGPSEIPEPGALQRPSHEFPWLADNQRKGISETPIATVHAAAEHSRRHWHDADEAVIEALSRAVRPYLSDGTHIVDAQLKRWRYALPEVSHDVPAMMATRLPPLAFAGDAFAGPRVEGAVLSGLTAARMLRQRLAAP